MSRNRAAGGPNTGTAVRMPAVAWMILLAALTQGACTHPRPMAKRYRDDPDATARLAREAEEHCAARGYPAGRPTFPFTTDGCTGWSDDAVHDCCVRHDMDYWCGGSAEDRRLADGRLRDCAEATYGPDSGPFLGWMMEAAVRAAGAPDLRTPWRWGYGHEYGEGTDETPDP